MAQRPLLDIPLTSLPDPHAADPAHCQKQDDHDRPYDDTGVAIKTVEMLRQLGGFGFGRRFGMADRNRCTVMAMLEAQISGGCDVHVGCGVTQPDHRVILGISTWSVESRDGRVWTTLEGTLISCCRHRVW